MNWSSATRGWIATLTAVSVAIAPPTLVFVVLCRWGRRASAGWAPCLLGFTLAAAATLMFHGSWALASAPGNSTVSIGFAWGAASISLARFGQLLVPLAIAGLYAWATRPAVAMPRAAVVSADSNRALAA